MRLVLRFGVPWDSQQPAAEAVALAHDWAAAEPKVERCDVLTVLPVADRHNTYDIEVGLTMIDEGEQTSWLVA